MKYVTDKKLTAFIFACLFVVGCKDPELQMTSLGKKLPAPVLTGTDPFEQDFSVQNHVRLQGKCDTRISSLFVSFDKKIWHQAPLTPDRTDTSLPAGQTNDLDCSDETFNIYLTKNDLLHIWSIDDDVDVDAIYIKGFSAIGDTEILSLIDKTPDNGGGGNAVATTINLEKNWPRGFAGTNQCGSFFVHLTDTSGRQAVHSGPVSFSIKLDGSTRIAAHTRSTDCYSGTNATSEFQIPGGSNYTEVFYRFPDSPIDGLLTFTLAYNDALTASPVPANVTLRSSDYSSTQRWLSLDNSKMQIYKNVCYPFNLQSHRYDNSVANDTNAGSLNIAASDARLKFYSNSSCTSATTKFTFANYSGSITGYMKFVPSGNESGNFLTVTASATGATGNTYNYDSTESKFQIDLSDKNSVTSMELWGPRNISNGDCNRYQAVTRNSNGTILPVTNDLNLSLTMSDANMGQFYSDVDCMNPTSSLTVNAGQSDQVFYFRASTTNPGAHSLSISAAGLSSVSAPVLIESVARQFKIYPIDLAAGSCKPISVGIVDGAGFAKVAPANIDTPLRAYLNPGGFTAIYADPGCSTMLGTSTGPLMIPQGATTGVVYIKTAGLAGVFVSITVDTFGGLFGADWSGTFQ